LEVLGGNLLKRKGEKKRKKRASLWATEANKQIINNQCVDCILTIIDQQVPLRNCRGKKGKKGQVGGPDAAGTRQTERKGLECVNGFDFPFYRTYCM